MNKGTVLSVDDDMNHQIVIEQYLTESGFPVKVAHNAEEACALFNENNIEIILLNLNLPDGEGLSLIPQFLVNSNCGLIVVSGKTDTTEKVVCLEMGADDYLTKPFEMRELVARIKAVIRRRESQGVANKNIKSLKKIPKDERPNNIKFMGWTLDFAQYQLFDPKGNSVDLTSGEFELLEALARSPNRVLSREKLFEMTRQSEYDAYDRAIDTQIARIRKKMGKNGDKLIQTVRGVGYKFSPNA